MARELASSEDRIPAYLASEVKKVPLGNLDQSDLIIPRVKLIQAISGEVTSHGAMPGEFFHTIAGEGMGTELIFVPILIRKSYTLWAPRNDDRGILARAMDGIHWDQPGAEFSVKPKGSPRQVTYRLGDTVRDSGLDKFGSSIPDDPRSPPAASLTYSILMLFPELIELSPAVVLNTRSSVKRAKMLISKIELRPIAHYAQQYKMCAVTEHGPEGPFYNYTYDGAGYASEEMMGMAKSMYERYSDAPFQASDESEEIVTPPMDDNIPF